jgi:hypothetical protein
MGFQVLAGLWLGEKLHLKARPFGHSMDRDVLDILIALSSDEKGEKEK